MVEREQVGWLSPAATWGQMGDLNQAKTQRRFLRPSILRFASDEFMEELTAILAYQPERMGQWEARFETWEQPMPTPAIPTELPSLTEPVSLFSTRITRARIQRNGELSKLSNGDEQENVRKLKLYQPIQQRFYLVTSSLVCRRTGFPDRQVNPGKQERASFVIRRILLAPGQNEPDDDPSNWDEYAYVKSASGQNWLQVKTSTSSADHYVDGEERLGLFSLPFTETSGHPRRMFCGVIPVGHREDYLATPTAASGEQDTSSDSTPSDPRLFLLQMQVTGPWNNLVNQASRQQVSFDERDELTDTLRDVFGTAPNDLDPGIITRTREQAQTLSWYILFDLERFLHTHLSAVWDELVATPGRTPLSSAEQALYLWLDSVTLDAGLSAELLAAPTGAGYQVASTLWEALQAVADSTVQEGLEKVETQFDRTLARNSENNALWPEFFFPLADSGTLGPLPLSIDGVDFAGVSLDLDNSNSTFDLVLEHLIDLVAQALPSDSETVMPELFLPDPQALHAGNAWFTIRCVYERPNCGPRAPTVVSAPTEPFEIASFFDPEAPARPARIGMPLDISPAGLRKFKKSTTLAVSDMLCGQLKRIRKLTLGDLVLSVLPWPFHKDLPNVGPAGSCKQQDGSPIGMFCSLSIPIVTLCALILLIIMVSLFDIFFRWLPYLFLCLPIPGLKGKQP